VPELTGLPLRGQGFFTGPSVPGWSGTRGALVVLR
jgi:hypothetical protein